MGESPHFNNFNHVKCMPSGASEWKLLLIPMLRHVEPEIQSFPLPEWGINFFNDLIRRATAVFMQLEELLPAPAVDG